MRRLWSAGGDARDGRCSECAHAPGQHPYDYDDVADALEMSGHDVEQTDNSDLHVNFAPSAAVIVQAPGWDGSGWSAVATEWAPDHGVAHEQVVATDTTAERCTLAVLSFLAAYDRRVAEFEAKYDAEAAEV